MAPTQNIIPNIRLQSYCRVLILVAVAIVASIIGCNMRPPAGPLLMKEKKKSISDELIRQELCNTYHLMPEDKRCPDSVLTVQLGKSPIYITQSYYGPGYGNGIVLHLVRMEGDRYTPLDTLLLDWPDYVFTPTPIVYNDTMNWFVCSTYGSGTNHYSDTRCIVRVKEGHFNELFSFPLYVSDMNPEAEPMTYTSLETTETEFTQEQIILHTRFEAGKITEDQSQPDRILEDTAVFEYSDSCQRYLWKSSTSPVFRNLWLGKIMYDAL